MKAEMSKISLVALLLCVLTSCSDESGSSFDSTGAFGDAALVKGAHRLLLQATFGPTQEAINRVGDIGAEAWIDEQLAAPSAYESASDAHQSHVERLIEIATTAEPSTAWYETSIFNQSGAGSALHYQMSAWWDNTLGLHPQKNQLGRDQLRQRMAFALSQILVASPGEFPLLQQRGEAQAYYYDILARNAFGNFRALLGEVARSPVMGMYLDHQGNRKTNLDKGTRPDENFAREVMQLFTVGLYQLNIDGSPDRDNNPDTYPDTGDALVLTYNQHDVEEMAKVMTGWDLAENPAFGNSHITHGNLIRPMEFTPAEHEDEAAEGGDGYVTVLGKTFALDAGADGSGLDAALDLLFNHQNTGPFISRQLIMRLVTSNPSSDYVARVAKVFNDNGQGEKGDLKAVTRAILVDAEARDPEHTGTAYYGKVKEPLLAWTQLLRAFGAVPLDGWKSSTGHAVDGVYWHYAPEQQLQQAALRSPSVFNFYSPDFVPSDRYFSNRKIVSPELQIQTEHMLLKYSNLVSELLTEMEKNSIQRIKRRSLASHASQFSHRNKAVLLINLDRELALFEKALEGDSNGNFSNIGNDQRKAEAVDALLIHLDALLLGNTMPDNYRAGLKAYLLKGTGIPDGNNFVEAHNLIRDAIRMIATSSAYMFQQ